MEAGLRTTVTDSAQFVMQSCLGQGRLEGADGMLPCAQTVCAVAFLQAIDAYGAFGSMDCDPADKNSASPTRALLSRAMQVETSHYVPYRSEWAAAPQVFWTEKSMSHQVANVLARQQDDGPAPEGDNGDVGDRTDSKSASGRDTGSDLRGAGPKDTSTREPAARRRRVTL